jgi:NADPH:quinone reductase-like Zn-dependent oxidoreductase
MRAAAGTADLEYARRLGAERAVDYEAERFEDSATGVDVVLDTVGGETQQRSLSVLKPGGILVSSVSPVSETEQERYGIRAAYFGVLSRGREYGAPEQARGAVRQRKADHPRGDPCSPGKRPAVPMRCSAVRRTSAARSC